jgi:hypothetical protein
VKAAAIGSPQIEGETNVSSEPTSCKLRAMKTDSILRSIGLERVMKVSSIMV